MEAGETRTFDVARLPAGRGVRPRPDDRVGARAPATPAYARRTDGSRLTLTADQGRARRARPSSGSSSATSPRRTRPPSAGPRPGSSSRSSARPRRRASRAPTRPPTRSARSRCRGSRRTTTAERRSSTTRSRRSGRAPRRSARPTSASSATSRTRGNYNFRVRACQPRRPQRLQRPVAAGAGRHRARAGSQNIRMKAQGDGQITIAWDKPSIGGTRILDYTITWIGGQAVVAGRPAELPRVRPEQQREVRLHDQGPEQGRLLRAALVAGVPAARHPAGAGGADGDRPRGRGQPDQPADRLAGRPARGPGPDGLHRLLQQRRHLGLRSRAARSSRP